MCLWPEALHTAALNESWLDKLPGQSEGPLRQVTIQKEIKIWILEGVADRAEKQTTVMPAGLNRKTPRRLWPERFKPFEERGTPAGVGGRVSPLLRV